MMNKINYSGYRFPPEIIPGKHTWEIEQVKFLSVEPRGPVWVDAVEKSAFCLALRSSHSNRRGNKLFQQPAKGTSQLLV
jgi:hypothetical protein